MAYWINATTRANNARQLQFYIDTDADVTTLPTISNFGVQQGDDTISFLPCGKGSTALSIASGNIFILNSNGSWIKIGG